MTESGQGQRDSPKNRGERFGFATPAPALPRYLAIRTSRLGDWCMQFLLRRGIGEVPLLLAFAVLVGVLTGFSILVFYRTIDLAAQLVGNLVVWLSIPRALTAIAILAIGLTLVRTLVRVMTDNSPGENIPDVMHAVARRGGVIRATPVAWKMLAAALTLGSGGSVGAEGPVAVLGATLGSRAGRYFRFRPERLRLLVGCGAAAGISGAFGAPIAGLFFALEKLIGGFRSVALAPLVLASVSAAAVTRIGLGEDQVIRIPAEYAPRSTTELFLYAGLGLLGGVVATIYNRGVWRLQDLFSRFPVWVRITVAAVLIGLVSALFDPALWGRGHQGLDLGLVRTQGPLILALLSVGKLIATALTLSAGGVGGVFTPALVIGGTFGAAAGSGLALVFPQAGLDPVPAALVGMTAVVSGSMHAPLTALFMVLEMTNDYALILPLMLGGSLSYVVARKLAPESIYTEWLARRGEKISHGTDESVLAILTVAEAFRGDPAVVRPEATLESVLPLVRRSSQLEFPVVDEGRRVLGILTWDALKGALADPEVPHSTPIMDLAQPLSEKVVPADSLLTALHQLGLRGSQILPVLDPLDDRLLGVIGRAEIFAAYERETA